MKDDGKTRFGARVNSARYWTACTLLILVGAGARVQVDGISQLLQEQGASLAYPVRYWWRTPDRNSRVIPQVDRTAVLPVLASQR